MTGKERYREKLNRHEWRITRERIVHRAMGVCEYCFESGDVFDVHHEKYTGANPWDTPDEHLKCICRRCHDLKHWTDRLAAYTKRKRELFDSGVIVTSEIDRNLIEVFEV